MYSSQSSPSVAISMFSRIAFPPSNSKTDRPDRISRSCRVHLVFLFNVSSLRQWSPSYGRGDRPRSTAGGSGEPPLPFATSRATGSSTRQTFLEQGSFGRLHSDECRRASSMKGCRLLEATLSKLRPLDFSSPSRKTFGQMQRHKWAFAFLRSPRAHLDFSLSPCR